MALAAEAVVEMAGPMALTALMVDRQGTTAAEAVLVAAEAETGPEELAELVLTAASSFRTTR